VWEGSGVAICRRAHHPVGKGSSVVMCHAVPDPPPGVGGLWRHHVPHGSQPLRRACVFPRRLTSSLSWPHQPRRAGIALNAYKTNHTQCMASIKCVQDIDRAGQRHDGVDLLVTRNEQATVQGDLMLLCSEATTVSGDLSTRRHTAHGRVVAERHDMHPSDHQHYQCLLLARVPLRYRGPTTLRPHVRPLVTV
jgi:hypothetical protein